MTKDYVVIGIVSLLVLGAIIYGFTLVGSPFDVRKEQLDQKRITDISTIQAEIGSYYYEKKVLPTTLNQVEENSTYATLNINDPETQSPYDYKAVSATSYQICATFDLATSTNRPEDYNYQKEYMHPQGYHCFDFKVTRY